MRRPAARQAFSFRPANAKSSSRPFAAAWATERKPGAGPAPLLASSSDSPVRLDSSSASPSAETSFPSATT
jgi:hypothetical protein